jgi:Ca-activated chloride channel family protein
MKFVNPWMLVLVALVPVAGAWWVFLRARAEKRLSGLVAPALQGRLLPRNPRLFNLQAALLLTGLALVLFAAARPQWGHSSQKMQARTRNVVVALDVSRSMLAADVRPNRLERAKADVADLIDSLEGDRCALVAFRRTGVLLCPLTTDHGFLRSTLESATPESAPRGETDLGSAIRTSLDALDPAADDHNAIILISDGGDLRGGARDAARLAAKRNVPVFTVGLGNPRAESAIPDASGSGSQQYQGKAVTTKLEEAALAEIAKLSGGRYVPLATAGTAETTLGAIYRRFLRQVAAKEQAEEEELRATERFGIFLVPGLLLVLLAGMFSRGRFAGRIARKAAVAALLLIAGMNAGAQDTNDVPCQAPSTKHQAPSTEYQAPAAQDDREIWNQGVDYYRAGDWTNALSTLQPLMLSRTHGARASEVVGAILNANAKRELAQAKSAQGVHAEDATLAPLRRAYSARNEGAWAMQRALRAAPDDPRANRNFSRAMDGLKELHDELHVEEVLAKAKGKDPKAQMADAAREALALLKEQASVLTNEAGVAVARSEALAKRAETLADALIPLKRTVLESVTNEQQAAEIVGDVESTRDATLRAADQLADLSSDAALSLSASENAFHRYWKGLLDPAGALTEAVGAQSNAVARAEKVNGRDWQQEALDFTQIFGTRFPEWVKQQCAQDMSFKSNEPPYTVRVAQEIGNAAQEIVKQQQALLKEPKDEDAALAMAGLARVRDRFGLLAADPRQLVAADILMQTNAYNDVERTDGFSWQKDAYDHTRAFRARFPAWAQQKEQEIQQKIQGGDTNAVPFTKEQQAEVAALATAVEKKQHVCLEKELPPEQLDVIRKLERIRELLPKDPNGGGQNNQQQQQQQNQDQNKDQDKKDNQDQQQDQQNQDEQKDDQQQQQEQKPQAEEPKDDKEVEELLRKAQERSDEHENDKKMRMRKMPPSPNERDW